MEGGIFEARFVSYIEPNLVRCILEAAHEVQVQNQWLVHREHSYCSIGDR
jgi:hypothetical protein